MFLLKNKSTWETCWIDVKTRKRKLDDCTSSLDLSIIDSNTLRGEGVFMCQRETDVDREKKSIAGSIGALHRDHSQIGSASSGALHH